MKELPNTLGDKLILANSEYDWIMYSIIELAKNNSMITIHISNFNDILQSRSFLNDPHLDPITHRDTLMTGLYAKYGNTRIYVDKEVVMGHYLDDEETRALLCKKQEFFSKPIARKPIDNTRLVKLIQEELDRK